MPRTPTVSMSTQLTTKTGTEPVLTLGINISTSFFWFATRAITIGATSFRGSILSVGQFRVSKQSNSVGSTGSVSLTLSDVEGNLKSLFDQAVLEQSTAVIQLYYPSLAASDMLELIRGRIVGPINWNEADRTLSFDVEAHIISAEMGYTGSVSDFADLSPEAEGIPWPMIFGKCGHVPAVNVRRHASGRLMSGITLRKSPSYEIAAGGNLLLKTNPTVYNFLNSAEADIIYVDGADNFPAGEITISIDGVLFTGSFTGNAFTVTAANVAKYTSVTIASRPAGDADVNNAAVLWIGEDLDLVNQNCYFNTSNGMQWMNICYRQEGRKCWFIDNFRSPVDGQEKLLTSGSIASVYAIPKNGMIASEGLSVLRKAQWTRTSNIAAAAMDSSEKLAASWWQAEADTEVRLWNADPEVYIASIVPLSEIHAVYGKRSVLMPDGRKRQIFCPIPTSMYTIDLASSYIVNGFNCAAIIFPKPLKDYESMEWEDDVYVTATSTVGPNPVSIISWILVNYTNLTQDTSAFTSVAAKLAAVEANFVLFDKRDALTTAQEIAFQCCCGLLTDSSVISIVYLAEKPSPALVLTESNVGSLTVRTTDTGEITTKYVGTWTETYRSRLPPASIDENNPTRIRRVIEALVPSNERRKTESRYLVYSNNLGTFGLNVREDNFYIYNSAEYVQWAMSFWGMRFSNSWKLISVKTFLNACTLRPFDGVSISLADACGMVTTGVVEDWEFDFADKSVTLDVWMPVLAGTNVEDNGAWL